MNKAQYFLKKHSTTILAVAGSTGVVATSVLAVKATPKAMLLVEEAKKEKGDDLTPVEVVKVAWKPYIPAVITGASTIACIFGINHLSVKNQASLMSAYALLDSSFKEYQNKVNELYGEDADKHVKEDIIKAKFDDVELEDGKELFFDYNSCRYFESTMDKVLQAETAFLEVLQNRGYACLNEYYDLLGIDYTEFGYQLGWMDLENNDPYNCKELEFSYEEVTIRDNIKCWIISTNMPAALDYII